jgi:hypothetical protein
MRKWGYSLGLFVSAMGEVILLFEVVEMVAVKPKNNVCFFITTAIE